MSNTAVALLRGELDAAIIRLTHAQTDAERNSAIIEVHDLAERRAPVCLPHTSEGVRLAIDMMEALATVETLEGAHRAALVSFVAAVRGALTECALAA